MLNELENIALSKLIGLANGIYDEENSFSTMDFVFSTLHGLQDKDDLQNIISSLVDKKLELLPNCCSCKSPCGRTNDVSLNDIENEEYRNAKIEDYYILLSSFQTMDFKDVLKALCRLAY